MKVYYAAIIIATLAINVAIPQSSLAQAFANAPHNAQFREAVPSGPHDFDFLFGHWQVHHRRLKKRLANNHEWVEFRGTLFTQPLMGGSANVDDTTFDAPAGAYRGVALRAFDPKSGQWLIWWLDGRSPTDPMDPPMRGSIHDGTGAFYGDTTESGKAIQVRFLWSKTSPTTRRWEQAYSPDGGKTWETNWVMDLKRVG